MVVKWDWEEEGKYIAWVMWGKWKGEEENRLKKNVGEMGEVKEWWWF